MEKNTRSTNTSPDSSPTETREMSLIRIDTNPPRRQLNMFGLFWLVFFSAVGAVVLARGASVGVAIAIWLAALLVPTIGWLVPAFMRVVYVTMAFATWPIGLVVSFAILVAVYYLVMTPIGLLMRVFGRDPMSRRFCRQGHTYWVPHRPADSIKRYFRQF